jgi:hypothetical protein
MGSMRHEKQKETPLLNGIAFSTPTITYSTNMDILS